MSSTDIDSSFAESGVARMLQEGTREKESGVHRKYPKKEERLSKNQR